MNSKYSINTSKRTQQQIAHKDDKGGSGGSRVVSGVGLPDWKPTEGVNKFNIIPWVVTNPMYIKAKDDPEFRIGDWEIGLDLMVHSYIGDGKKDFLCLAQFGLPCPCCKQMRAKYDEADETGSTALKEEGNTLRSKRRTFFVVQPIVKGEPQALALWNASHYSFTGKLWGEANDNPNGGGPVDFANPENGKIVYFRAEVDTNMKKGKNKVFKYEGLKFLDRDFEFDVDLGTVPSLDKFMVIPKPEDMEAAMFGGPTEPEESEPDQARPGEEAGAAPLEQETERTSAPSSSPSSAPSSGQAVPPPVTTVTTSSAPSAPIAETAPMPVQPGSCPKGHSFGKDNGMHPDCGGCTVFDPCFQASL